MIYNFHLFGFYRTTREVGQKSPPRLPGLSSEVYAALNTVAENGPEYAQKKLYMLSKYINLKH